MWPRQKEQQRALKVKNWPATERDSQKALQHEKSKKKNISPEKQPGDLVENEQEQEPNDRQRLASALLELEQMKKNQAHLLKQYEVLKKEKHPLTSSEKVAEWYKLRIASEDDEEPDASWLRREPTSSVPCSESLKRRHQFEHSSSSLEASAKKARLHDEQREASPSTMSIVTTSSASESSASASSSATLPASSLRTQSPDRSLTAEEEAADELKYLRTGNYAPAEAKRKRPRTSVLASHGLTADEVREQALDALKRNFRFTAIVSYDEDMDVDDYFDSFEDLDDCVEDLWDATLDINEAWEASSGEYWKFEFESKLRGRPANFCVSTVLKIPGRESGRCAWRLGGKGIFACKKCVQEGKPCFLWDGAGFRLLPLHQDDRLYEPKFGSGEVWNWLNME